MAHKNVAKVGLAELAKRVPPNQALQFQDFQSKHHAYQARVNKQPEKLPTIDWEFYRINVRPDQQKWVDEFQQKYKALCETFDAREQQDYSKYYVELEQARSEMQEEIEKFKAESNERIKALEGELNAVQALKPYEDMTMEEYCDLLPEKKMFTYEGHPSFWPHLPEEQSLEPLVKGHGHDDHGDDHGKPPKGGDGGSTTGGSAPPASAAPATPAAPAAASEKKDAKAESKEDANTTKTAEKAQNKQAGELVASPKTADTPKSVEIAQSKADLANKLIEEEIRNALVCSLLEETNSKDRQAITTKK